jgi:hypothetical protein
VRELYQAHLGVDAVSDADSFVSLGGDSLTFVETSLRLENLLGTLPPDWHVLTVGDLEARRSIARTGPIAWMDTCAVLRAMAILLICSYHSGLTGWWGGAYLLLGVAGFNFARFQLNSVVASGRVRPLLQLIVRIAMPSALVIGLLYLLTDAYDFSNVLLVRTLLGPEFAADPGDWDVHWNFWFVEVLFAILVLWTVLLSVPVVRRLARARPFGFAAATLAVCLALRFDLEEGKVVFTSSLQLTVLWMFALGWAAALATRVVDRLFLSVIALCGALLPGFTDHGTDRKVVFLGGLLLLIWGITRMPVPAPLTRLIALLAGASLWIYLTHFQVLDFLWSLRIPFVGFGDNAAQPGLLLDVRLAVVTVIALAVGVCAWKAYDGAALYLKVFLRTSQNRWRRPRGSVARPLPGQG